MSSNNVDYSKKFTCISLCSGYCGIELGLRKVISNLCTIAYVEREGFAVANLVAKIEAGRLDAAPIWTDIKTFDGKPFRNKVHLITSGFPCQPFSVAGKRKGTDDPRHLWPYIAGIVQAVRPVWCFFENVPGHLTIGYPEVYRSLRNMGYSVEAGIFSAAECGAPHRRERLFILAHASRLRCIAGRAKQSLQGIGPDGFTQQLADTDQQGPQRRDGGVLQERTSQLSIRQGSTWPSRPGQPQYEWEEPRVVADTKKYNRGKAKGRIPTKAKRESRSERFEDKSGQGQAQSRLGGESDGSIIALDIAKGIRGGYYVKPGGELGHDLVLEAKMRVDRLRLLGNGVVPQQAEKAFRYLMGLFK